MGEKTYGSEKSKKKRVQKTKCPSCKKEINVDEEIQLGNVERIGEIRFIFCPVCGEEIII